MANGVNIPGPGAAMALAVGVGIYSIGKAIEGGYSCEAAGFIGLMFVVVFAAIGATVWIEKMQGKR